MKLSGWGRFPVLEAAVFAPRNESALIERVRAGRLIARGNGRAYGDSAISRQNTVHMRHFDRMLAFDEATGQLVAEAGVLLDDVIRALLPRGWFPAVTPGTKFVTLGGMVAADVHGKNHHKAGSLRNFVDWFDLIDASGTVRHCSRTENTDLFDWTLGGMGLTGVILRVAMRLRPVETAWIRQTVMPAADIDAAIDLLEQSGDATYSVAWVDCLSKGAKMGRSLILLGEHALLEELTERQRESPLRIDRRRELEVPFLAPNGLLNGLTARVFNALYYWQGQRTAGTSLVDWNSYFYPLDVVLGWNRICGSRGLMQFQCVLPLDRSRIGLKALLEGISRTPAGPLLAVLKRFGAQSGGISFPMSGYTLALDLPVGERSLRLMRELDRITLAHDGRFYLAKDSRMTADTLRQSDARAQKFVQMRDKLAARSAFQSAQSERLAL